MIYGCLEHGVTAENKRRCTQRSVQYEPSSCTDYGMSPRMVDNDFDDVEFPEPVYTAECEASRAVSP